MSEQKLNIVLYSNSFLPHVGGREIVVYHLAKALVEAGHKARVVCPGGWWSYRKYAYPFKVQRWPKVPGLSDLRSSQLNLTLNILLNGCDVVNAHSTYLAGFVALQHKRYSHLPLIVTPHGEDIHIIPEIGHGMRLIPELADKIKQVLNGAERMTAISESVVASLLDAGASREKIMEIPNGVDFTRFTGESTFDVRQKFSIPSNKRILLTVGNYVRRRGHEELVRSMPSIVAKNSDAHLVIVGRGTDVLSPMIEELGIADNITLTGAVQPVEMDHRADDIVGALYRESEVYVAPGMSEGSEGLSLALLDAMAAGSSIVATDISGNRDLIRNESNGLLVKPSEPEAIAEGVNQMLADKALQENCKATALVDVQPYDWKAIAEQYVQTYRDAIVIAKQGKG